MKIVLKMPLETPTQYYEAGTEVDVDEVTYDWLVASYVELRVKEAQELSKLEGKS